MTKGEERQARVEGTTPSDEAGKGPQGHEEVLPGSGHSFAKKHDQGMS